MIWLLPQTDFSARAESTIWDGTADITWYNETETCFTITTAEQLAGLAQLVNGSNDFTGKTITLDADIHMNDTTGWETWDDTYTEKAWEPIGNARDIYFNGTIDGGSHTISGMYIYAVDTSADYVYAGLFGNINSDAVVSNVNITESNILGEGRYYTYVGGVVGKSLGTVSNCSNSGNVRALTYSHSYVDGIIKSYDNKTFGANDTITREQAMVMIARAMEIVGLETNLSDSEINQLLGNFVDGATASAYAQNSIATCPETGIISGTSDSTISPKANITRAEVAVIVMRLLQNSGLI